LTTDKVAAGEDMMAITNTATSAGLAPNIAQSLAHDIAATKAPINRARHLPGYMYTSPEIYDLEKEKIFMRDWLCVARAEEVTNPGDYMTFRLMNEPFIIARAHDGTVHAYRNSCAHRGLVVAKESGSAKGFTCEYHGWSYDLTGQLVGAPFMDNVEDFDLSTCRLGTLCCEVWAGWVFVSFNAAVGPLSDDVALFEDQFAMLDMGACRTGDKQVWDLGCNWKIMDENNHDLYHIQATHAGTFGAGITTEGLGFNLHESGRFSAFYSDPPLVPEGKSVFGAMPWMKDQPGDFACLGHMPPNFGIVGRIDSVLAVLAWPVSLTETRLIVYQLFPEEVFERPDLDEKMKVHHDFAHIVFEEDTGIVVDTQEAVALASYQPGPISRMEASIHHTFAHYLDRVFDA